MLKTNNAIDTRYRDFYSYCDLTEAKGQKIRNRRQSFRTGTNIVPENTKNTDFETLMKLTIATSYNWIEI